MKTRMAQAPTQASVSATATAFTISTNEVSTQALEDDTEIELSAHATVDVDYTPGQRVVRLRAGGATFDVAKDPNRPFIVLADGLRATALGTKFRVSLAPTVRVEVYEGVVGVTERQAKAGAMTLKLTAGQVYQRPNSSKTRIGVVQERNKPPSL
ncbi:MAG TPA: FecR domain-containing protein [Steroidobacter sp.]|uniref:FecR domain-containing protein n=1 Tax=Steroidobacter sp. TaxID=1978227 RepID=UPI002EDA34E5